MKARILASLLLLLGLIAPVAAVSQGVPAARLETRLERPAKIWVGQRLALDITLYTSGTFSGVPRFDLPKDSGMLIMGDDSRPVLGSREIDGMSYLSAQYTVNLFPLRAGTLEVPAFKVEFAYRDDNRREVPVTLTTTPQRFSVLAVPGADPGLPLVTSTALEVTDRWNPRPGKAKVGDAFTRTITLTAEGLPGMLLPPLQPASLDGLAVYPNPPQVTTATERGAFTGKRQDNFSYVFEKPGRYHLPIIQLQWWNPKSEVLKIIELKAVDFEVAPNPLLRGGGAASVAESGRSRWVGAMGILTGAVVMAGWILLRRRHRKTSRDREAAVFSAFERAARANDAQGTVTALFRWLDMTGLGGHPACLSGFARAMNDPELSDQLDRLEQRLYGPRDAEWSGQALYRAVARARRNHRHFRPDHGREGHLLAPLNPR